MQTEFQDILQTQIEWCWAAVGASISAYFFPDAPKKECEIAQLVTKQRGCCNPNPPASANVPEELEDALAVVGGLTLAPRQNSPISFADLQTQLDAGLPVGVRIAWFGEFGAHFVIVYGWGLTASNEQWVHVADPFFNTLTIPYRSLVDRYLDMGEWTDTFLMKKAVSSRSI